MSAQIKNPPGLPPFNVIPAEVYPTNDDIPSSGSPRLLFLIPDVRIDYEKLTRAIYRLGFATGQQIILLGSPRHGGDQTKFYRLAIDLRASGWKVTIHSLKPNEEWAGVLRATAQPDDLVACHAEYDGEKLCQEISAHLGLSVYVLTGLYPTRSKRWLQVVGRGIFEIMPLAIIAGMFGFQIQIAEQTSGILTTVITIMTVLFEVGLLFIWSLALPRDNYGK